MKTRLADLLKMIADPDGNVTLRAALVDEEPMREETFSALVHIFVVAAGELTSGSGTASLKGPHLRVAEIAISALKLRRDYETLFKLAACSSVPGRPRLLAELCLDAARQAGEKQDLHDLALYNLDAEANEPVQTAFVLTAAKLLLRLGEDGFHPAYLTIGDLFKDGIALPRDFDQAQSWYARAAIANSFEASQMARNVAAAFCELLEILETTQDSETKIRTAEFFRLQISLADEFAKRVKAMAPHQGVDCLIQKGETDRTEFKETLRWDTRKGKCNSDLENSVIQTVAAFMNADGGTLFIGVTNEKEPLGLQRDYDSFSKEKDRNQDGFERHLRQILRRDLGESTHLYSIAFIPYPEKHICQVTVRPSDKPIFVKNEAEKLWIRDGNSKRVLAGSELEEYNRRHWAT